MKIDLWKPKKLTKKGLSKVLKSSLPKNRLLLDVKKAPTSL